MACTLSGLGKGTLRLLPAAAILVFFINIPFGYWRSRVRRFSGRWIMAVHMPVPFVIACRLLLGLGWHLVTFPVLIGAYFAGQLAGGKLGHLIDPNPGIRRDPPDSQAGS
jgi:hypothetical protein